MAGIGLSARPVAGSVDELLAGATGRAPLELALLGGFLQLGWSKTGDRAELDWRLRRVAPVARGLLS